mmetsp:Transcript_6289/g.14517  ORF Transcript_6289/g.14517 Transcript_6289/m.14517 type:complete len:341 (-) Transcript_6289:1413-2435(-)
MDNDLAQILLVRLLLLVGVALLYRRLERFRRQLQPCVRPLERRWQRRVLLPAAEVEVGEERLGHEQHRHRDERGDEQEELQVLLPVEEPVLLLVDARRHEHGDERVQQRGRPQRKTDPVSRPLEQDHEHEVAEDGEEEDELGDELEPDGAHVAELEVVEQRERDAERHLRHAEDNGDLHLERVEEGHLIRRQLPRGIDAEGHHRAVPRVFRRVGRQVVRGAEEAEGHREGLVVDEADVGGEGAVEEEHVPPAVDHREDVVELLLAERLLVADEVQREEQQQRPVSDVAEHDPEEEGEADDGESARVHLAVPGETVRVDQPLETRGELVCRQVRRRRLVRL